VDQPERVVLEFYVSTPAEYGGVSVNAEQSHTMASKPDCTSFLPSGALCYDAGSCLTAFASHDLFVSAFSTASGFLSITVK